MNERSRACDLADGGNTRAPGGWRRVLAAAVAACLAAAGCTAPHVTMPVTAERIGYEERLRQIDTDPMAFLRAAFKTTDALEQYAMTFQRQERLGMFKQLAPMETLHAEYRRRPLSVRFTWLADDSEYRQCVFVENRNDGKVLLLPRHGLFGMKPTVGAYHPSLAVTFSKTRNPITDFGPRRMIERTIDRIRKAEPHGGVKITRRDPVEIGPFKERCFALELRYPPGDEFACKLQDLYVSVKTNVPVATYLWLPGKEERCSDTLDAMYVYAGLDPDVKLSDADFVIDPDGVKPGRAAAVRTAGHGGANPTAAAAARSTQDADQ